MSKIGTTEVERIAKLARIGITPEQAARLAVEMGQIVEFVEQLQAVELGETGSTDQVTGLLNVTRPDVVVIAPQSRDELLANAPVVRDGYIVVKRVLNG